MSIPSQVVIYQDNDQYVQIDGLVDATNPTSYINGASGTVSLLDQSGVSVGSFGSVALNYVTGSNGSYRAAIPNTFNAPLGKGYTLLLEVTYGVAKLKLEIPAIVRTNSGR